MSGRKRALLRMNERDRRRLMNIESRLGQVDQDFVSLQSKIDEMRSHVTNRVEEERDLRNFEIEKSISYLDWRIQEIEEATQLAIEQQIEKTNNLIHDANNKFEPIQEEINNHSNLIIDLIGQYTEELNQDIKTVTDDYHRGRIQVHNQQESSWQTLRYAEELILMLRNQHAHQTKWENEFNLTELQISTGWANYQNGVYQAALVCAQQAIIKMVELRFIIEDEFKQIESKRLEVLEFATQLIDLASNSKQVNAIDLDGNELDVNIDVDYWSGGSINKAIQVLQSIQDELLSPANQFNIPILNDLLSQTLPEWEKALQNYVSLARIEVIASQTRYEVARTVVNALAEQGFELENGSFETGDLRSPYHVLLGNLEGNKVHVCVSPSEDTPLNYLLEIDSFDKDIKTEYELRQRAKELLGSIEAVGLRVDQVYKVNKNIANSVKEAPIFQYKTKASSQRQKI